MRQSMRTIGLVVGWVLLSLTLSACDLLTSPQETTEDIAFEGAPQITIASPMNGDTYQAGVGVNILLRVDNAGPDVARVAIQVDGQIIGEATMPNPNGDPSFTVSNGWPATGEGQHVISAVVSRADGTNSEASVTINVVTSQTNDDSASDEPDTDEPEEPEDDAGASNVIGDTPLPTPVPREPTNTVVPTIAPTNTPAPTATSSRPQVRVQTGANVRSGPGLVFDPPVGSLAANETVDILAVNNAGTWFRIQYYNGDAWISAQVVDVIGDISSLPREAGPPTPVPPTETPIPATQPPASNIDLIIDANQTSVVPTFRCGLASEITVTVVNQGTERSAGTSIIAEDIQPNGDIGATTNGAVPALDPNQSATVVVYLTVTTFVNEGHTFRVRVDPNNSIAESNETNNNYVYEYNLEPGSC
ncbi:MAG: CARDB domain-containing protein [Anaerolineae bacterium]